MAGAELNTNGSLLNRYKPQIVLIFSNSSHESAHLIVNKHFSNQSHKNIDNYLNR